MDIENISCWQMFKSYYNFNNIFQEQKIQQ